MGGGCLDNAVTVPNSLGASCKETTPRVKHEQDSTQTQKCISQEHLCLRTNETV